MKGDLFKKNFMMFGKMASVTYLVCEVKGSDWVQAVVVGSDNSDYSVGDLEDVYLGDVNLEKVTGKLTVTEGA